MEKRTGRVIFTKAGGNASKNAYNCKISIPKKWVDAMGVTKDNREVTLKFDGKVITIKKGGDQYEE